MIELTETSRVDDGSPPQKARPQGLTEVRQINITHCRYYFLLFVCIAELIACGDAIKHDPVLAGRRAEEFARVTFVRRDFERGYDLLSDSGRRYVSLDKFKETVSRLHPKAYPLSVKALEYEPMAGEKAAYIFVTGQDSGEHFYYRLTLEGDANTDYRVVRFTRSHEPYPPSNQKQEIKAQS
jgi:hypothetical protein